MTSAVHDLTALFVTVAVRVNEATQLSDGFGISPSNTVLVSEEYMHECQNTMYKHSPYFGRGWRPSSFDHRCILVAMCWQRKEEEEEEEEEDDEEVRNGGGDGMVMLMTMVTRSQEGGTRFPNSISTNSRSSAPWRRYW